MRELVLSGIKDEKKMSVEKRFQLLIKQRQQWFFLCPIVLAYLLSRLLWLEQIPIFSDEAVHIARAKWALAGDMLAGLEMSKWLTMQAYGVYFGFFPDTLFSARALIVMIGLVNMLLIFKLACEFGEQRSFLRGTFAAATYVVLPLALFYDRVFVADQFQVFFCCSIFISALRLLRQQKKFNLRNGLMLALLMLLAFLFKTSGLLFAAIPVVLVFLLAAPELAVSVRLRDRFLRVLPSYLLYVPLMLGFSLWGGSHTDTQGFLSFAPENILIALSVNPVPTLYCLWQSLTPLVCTVMVGGVLVILLSSKNILLRQCVCVCMVIIGLILIPYILFCSEWALRYFLPILVPVCLLMGILFQNLAVFLVQHFLFVRQRMAQGMLAVLLLGAPVAYSGILLAVPDGYNCSGDFYLYFTFRTSGAGVRDAARFLGHTANASESDYIIVVSPNAEDGMNQGLDVYWREMGSKVRHRMVTLESKYISQQMRLFLQRGRPVYLARNDIRKDKGMMKILQKDFKMRLCWHSARPQGYPGQKIFRIENNKS